MEPHPGDIAMTQSPTVATITGQIHTFRGERVMLDTELATLYGVKTERLNEQVKRNPGRFPQAFMFRLSEQEWRSMYPQNAGTSQRRRRLDRLPLAFTEHGCLMLSNVLKSPQAVQVSVLIVQAFVGLRAAVMANHELARRVDELERAMGRQIGNHGRKLAAHDSAILRLLGEIRRLTRFPESPRREIGFTAQWPTETSKRDESS
jgi:hypothetical protein